MKFYYLAPLILFSLWDYYIPSLGGRVLDYLGIVLILMCLSFRVMKIDFMQLKYSYGYMLIMMAMFPSVIFAYMQGQWLPATAFLTGFLFVYKFYFSSSFSSDKFQNQIGWLILINLLFFFFQYVAYKFSGRVVDYHSYFRVISPRVFNEELGYFRAAGLFQEPNSFCLLLYMLNVLRIFFRHRKFDWLFFASMTAMFISKSFWGFGAILVLVLVWIGSFRLNRIRLVLLLCLIGLALSVLVFFTRPLDVFVSILEPNTATRIINIDEDASLNARYKLDADIVLDGNFLFGRGLNTVSSQWLLGANAIGFYLSSFGFLGLLFFFGWIMIDSKKGRYGIGLVILFAMTSFPLFTTAFWWAWLGILIRGTKVRGEDAY